MNVVSKAASALAALRFHSMHSTNDGAFSRWLEALTLYRPNSGRELANGVSIGIRPSGTSGTQKRCYMQPFWLRPTKEVPTSDAEVMEDLFSSRKSSRRSTKSIRYERKLPGRGRKRSRSHSTE